MFPHVMNVLSLFSGIGGAKVALQKLGIHIKNVLSGENSTVNKFRGTEAISIICQFKTGIGGAEVSLYKLGIHIMNVVSGENSKANKETHFTWTGLRDMFPHGMNVSSLFSRIGGAEVALHKLGIHIKNVVSGENSKVNKVVYI
ncbi:hypothetical protein PR202_ga16121 [Eleusine coracana subsp. coracana]|uniref:Uncharacterized protein n=1 Tax=Eleusine coracana subsp. coracana TaxID=191504 RepID=A0AAV5CLZ3_ELECO|nr:hypothetical protein PR202_ga16121 [Eleusine coracana subsp. coracana]